MSASSFELLSVCKDTGYAGGDSHAWTPSRQRHHHQAEAMLVYTEEFRAARATS